MVSIRRIFKNSTWMMASQTVTNLCAFVWTILMARYLGTSDFGILSFAISLSSIVGILMDSGTQTYIVRAVSKNYNKTEEYFEKTVPLKLVLSLLIIIGTIAFLILTGRSSSIIEVSFIMLCQYTFLSMNNFFYGIFQAYEKMEYQSIATVLNAIILLIIVFLTMYFDLGLYGMAFGYLIAIFGSFLYIYSKISNLNINPHYSFDYNFSKELLKLALPFGLTGIFYSIYYTIDMTMLEYLATSSAVGMYNASYKIISLITTFYALYPQVIFPVMVKLFEDSTDLMKISYEKSIKYLLLIILPICAGVILYSEPLMTLIYGDQYTGSGSIVMVLMFTIPFLFVNGTSTVAMNSSNKEMSVTKIYFIAAIFNVVLNLILIPKYSYIGAAIATVLSEILITILMFKVTLKAEYAPGWVVLKDVIKILIASIIMFIILDYLKINMFLGIVIGAIIYVAMIFIERTLDDTDKNILKSIINKE